MHKLLIINRILLILLGISTGAVKLAQLPDEVRIFTAAGFGTGLFMAFGGVQIVAALLVIPDGLQRIGGALLGVTFAVATGVLFVNGMVPFGVVSLLFIAMSALVALRGRPWASPRTPG